TINGPRSAPHGPTNSNPPKIVNNNNNVDICNEPNFEKTGRGLLIGVCLTCAVQGFVAAIAYLCLQIPRWYALGVLTG
ncbi:unnamed protein product, partial [Adineta steineri]